MKKNISINIGGIIFHMEEDGYDNLKNYLDSVNKYFSSFEDNKEIIEDIEGRIAEIFLARLDEGKQVISQEDVDDLIGIMGTTKDFDATIETEGAEEKEEDAKQGDTGEKAKTKEDKKENKKLRRDTKRRVLGGVAAGMAHYLNMDPIWVRLIFLILFFNVFFFLEYISGFTLLAYTILWIAIPRSDDLEEDKSVKKLYRDPDDRILGGISSGMASYFGVDIAVVRILFIVSIFTGAGILVYIILWIIVPEAKTITEKMQMQGEPVTISNIEENVKKSLNVKEGEESAFVKVILFPFRLIAMIFKALGEVLGPLLKFSVDVIRVVAGVFLVFIGFVLTISFTVMLAALLGIGGTMDNWVQLGSFPAEYLVGSVSTVTLIAAYIVSMIPTLGILFIGLTIIAKKAIVKSYIGWSMFGLWLLGVIILAISVPVIVHDFRTENTYKEKRTFESTYDTPTLDLNYIDQDHDLSYHDVDLRLRGHSDSTYLLSLEFESRGSSRVDARDNAEAVNYKVEKRGEDFIFDPHLTFQEGTPFRFQNLEATFYIPYGKTFYMDEDLAEILVNTLHLNGYRAYQMEDNEWVLDENGINCTTCEEDSRDITYWRDRKPGENSEVFGFTHFDEVVISSLFDFEIKRGYQYYVELQGGDWDEISVIQSGDELEIKFNENWKWWKGISWKKKAKLFIVMPELEYLSVSGACEGEVRGFDNDEMKIKIDGASEVRVEMQMGDTYVDVGGASELTLIGRTDHLEVDVVGASELNAYDFEAKEADVKAVGASTVRVHVVDGLEAEAVGASTIRYRGNPIVSSDSKGFSSVRKD